MADWHRSGVRISRRGSGGYYASALDDFRHDSRGGRVLPWIGWEVSCVFASADRESVACMTTTFPAEESRPPHDTISLLKIAPVN